MPSKEKVEKVVINDYLIFDLDLALVRSKSVSCSVKSVSAGTTEHSVGDI